MAIDAPYGVTLPPRRSLPTEEAELERELAELDEIQRKNLRAKERARDPIAELFGGKFCILNKCFWFIDYQSAPVRVHRYYPDKNVAVDVFPVIGPEETREIAFKRVAFKRERIRYGALSYAMDVAQLLPQIEHVRLWPFRKD
jgi:hypothetical protein